MHCFLYSKQVLFYWPTFSNLSYNKYSIEVYSLFNNINDLKELEVCKL